MDKVYNHKDIEDAIYKKWEEKGYFKPEIHPQGEPYTIILPPPNANGDLHFGHAMFVLEDIMIRYQRMQGKAALWLPGTDHAGTETQFVYEKKLQAEGKSRLDFSREDLYQQVWDFVSKSRGGIQSQLKRLGFSLDWSREKFTLDPDIVEIVSQTFEQMHKDGLVYRDYRLVNYCTRDGTSFSDLEVLHEERQNPLYYIKYGPLVLATTRPETKFGDTGVAVHPDDSRYKQYIGQEIEIETVLGKAKIKVVGDESVDPAFGTGVVKITPAHDFTDFETGKRHNLPMKQVIGFDGKMNEYAGKFAGLYVKQARAAIVEEMQQKGLIEKIDTEYIHRIGLCYKCKTVLEPLPLEQWYVKVKPLTEKALATLTDGNTKVYPESFSKNLVAWYKNLRDWNISRQNVWGIRIPVWYEIIDEDKFTVSFLDKDKQLQQGTLKNVLAKGYLLEEIEKGLQRVIAKMDVPVVFENQKESGKRYLPETDTFDTWFSSAQWPYVTLMTSGEGDFERFYPTNVMETGRDILFFWVSRMLMMGLYKYNEVPFKDVVLHGLVNDPLGKKMSKSKGNVVNPLEVADQYGADSVRMALVYGTALGNDQAMSYPKLEAMRKFSNKLWNMARFMEFQRTKYPELKVKLFEWDELISLNKDDTGSVEILKKSLIQIVKDITFYLDRYQFNLAAEKLYEYSWHEFADLHIENIKKSLENEDPETREKSFNSLISSYAIILKLLHPFMPFITEEIYQKLPGHDESLMISSWPK